MNKTNILIFIFLLLGTVSCTPLSEGLTMKSEVYNADNVEFYYDLTYKKMEKLIMKGRFGSRLTIFWIRRKTFS
ncbi:hypothetical protein [Leptotrichia hofstadii]|uniref:Lipoprotein n=1 Tax=Leptotrichia hofstadii F0254 TaxID=634994 RepID=C9MU02_9FUSO|nr:hypothetical protein [Leptotrichia hofstadii]EEX75809.1 hypothetical protein GCWU000323_00020 [Leptotrichia hofstadii F0254]